MRSVFAAVFLSLLLLASAFSNDYGLVPAYAADTVYFNSTARLEFIEGKTQSIEGAFSYAPGEPGGGISGVLKVDLRTLRTGIDKRDEHMRENHLHTEEYPFAFFQIDSIDFAPSLTTLDSMYHARAHGKFFIHGIYRNIEADLELVRTQMRAGEESITVRARFSMNLDDFKIPRPKALFLKLAETIEVEVVFKGFSQASTKPVTLPEWPQLD